MSLLFLRHPDETDLALFAGGELGPLGRWRIERHLQACHACQDTVSDFFHLQSEMGELAQTPPLDWKALAHNIGARVRQEVPARIEAPQSWLTHPRAWQVGLAATALLCTIVVVRQFPSLRQGVTVRQGVPVRQGVSEPAPLETAQSKLLDKMDAPAGKALGGYAEQADAEAPRTPESKSKQMAQAAGEESGRANLARESNDTAAAGQSTNAVAAPRDRLDAEVSFRASPGKEMAPDIAAQSAPVGEPLSRQAASEGTVESSADRRQRPSYPAPAQERAGAKGLSVDEKEAPAALAELRQAAPASPAPKPAAPAEADSAALQDRAGSLRAGQSVVGGVASPALEQAGGRRKTEQVKTEQVKIAQASKAVSTSLRALRAPQNRLEKKADADAVSTPERGFTVLPAALEDPTVDVGVAADGWISVRSLDANTGTITITDVYVP